jgi:hypothetical protein
MHAIPEIRHGRLVRVLPDYTFGEGNVFLVHPAAKVLPAKARAFRDFLVANLELFMHGPECMEARARERAEAATGARARRVSRS